MGFRGGGAGGAGGGAGGTSFTALGADALGADALAADGLGADALAADGLGAAFLVAGFLTADFLTTFREDDGRDGRAERTGRRAATVRFLSGFRVEVVRAFPARRNFAMPVGDSNKSPITRSRSCIAQTLVERVDAHPMPLRQNLQGLPPLEYVIFG